ncbi:Fungal specific transcription factor domain-containing protein [Cladophialophora immunda]|nr:Fungal specific transcription factor domain-containing protein [Cladophialophora immunda]
MDGGRVEDSYRKYVKIRIKSRSGPRRRTHPDSERSSCTESERSSSSSEVQLDDQRRVLSSPFQCPSWPDPILSPSFDLAASFADYLQPGQRDPQRPEVISGEGGVAGMASSGASALEVNALTVGATPERFSWINGHYARIPESYNDYSSRLTDDPPALLMHYLDHVFHLQYPLFSKTAVIHSRSWVLDMMYECASFYWLVLGLASYHKESTAATSNQYLGPSEPGQLAGWRVYHAFGLHEFRQTVASMGQDNSVDAGTGKVEKGLQILACVVQFLSFKLLGASVEETGVHRGAEVFLFDVVKDCAHLGQPSSETSQVQQVPISTSMKHQSLPIFVSSIIWYAALSSLSIREPPFAVRILDLVENTPLLQVRSSFGCETWLIVSLNQVSDLDAWQAQMAADNCLSRLELSTKAEVIWLQLERNMEMSTKASSSKAQKAPLGGELDLDAISSIVTAAYARTVLVYLHTVYLGHIPSSAKFRKMLNT